LEFIKNLTKVANRPPLAVFFFAEQKNSQLAPAIATGVIHKEGHEVFP